MWGVISTQLHLMHNGAGYVIVLNCAILVIVAMCTVYSTYVQYSTCVQHCRVQYCTVHMYCAILVIVAMCTCVQYAGEQ